MSSRRSTAVSEPKQAKTTTANANRSTTTLHKWFAWPCASKACPPDLPTGENITDRHGGKHREIAMPVEGDRGSNDAGA